MTCSQDPLLVLTFLVVVTVIVNQCIKQRSVIRHVGFGILCYYILYLQRDLCDTVMYATHRVVRYPCIYEHEILID
jgi:hypothetical protein